jgi:hypothetical protein
MFSSPLHSRQKRSAGRRIVTARFAAPVIVSLPLRLATHPQLDARSCRD